MKNVIYKGFELSFKWKLDSIRFHHLCKIKKDNQLIKTVRQQWFDGAWEDYEFATVERRAKEFIDLIIK